MIILKILDLYPNLKNLKGILFLIMESTINNPIFHAGYYSAGIVGTAQYLEHPKKILRDFLEENGLSGDFPVRSHIIPKGGIKRKILNSRLLLSGDAAGFVDAFTGEGLSYAIRSGQLAAEAVADLVMFTIKSSTGLKIIIPANRRAVEGIIVSPLKDNKRK